MKVWRSAGCKVVGLSQASRTRQNDLPIWKSRRKNARAVLLLNGFELGLQRIGGLGQRSGVAFAATIAFEPCRSTRASPATDHLRRAQCGHQRKEWNREPLTWLAVRADRN